VATSRLVLSAILILAGSASFIAPRANAQGVTCDGDIVTPESIRLEENNLDVKLELDSASDQPPRFKVTFLDAATGNVQPHIDYNLVITDTSENEIFNAAAVTRQDILHTAEGIVTIPTTLAVDGYGIAIVSVSGINFIPIETQLASFPCIQIPEFPIGAVGIFAAILVTIVATLRLKAIRDTTPRL
jgi:hypothetical protein